MAFVPGNNLGVFNGTTPVTVVSAPGAATYRLIKTLTIQNKDTAAVTITLRYTDSGTDYQLWKGVLAVNDTFVWPETLDLADTTQSITAVMSGAPATTQPEFTAHFADYS